LNVKTYIESGILEQYVLGKLPAAEAAEVTEFAQKYPEVQQELTSIEQTLEFYVFAQAISPPPGVLDRILQRIDADSVQIPTKSSLISNARPRTWSRLSAVGLAFALLAAVAGLAFLYFQNEKLQDQVRTKQAQIDKAQVACDSISETLNVLQAEFGFVKNRNTRPIVMTGKNGRAAVYVNSESGQVYLGNVQLRVPSTGKQYQLWAIVDGKPTDMGVFDIPTQGNVFIKVPFVANAQAFAVSLEDVGGKPQPTEVVIIGNVT